LPFAVRLFGDLGQEILSRLKVGIIGLGGGGSLVNEWLARLGVGHIVGIDFDQIEPSNLPRVVGATRWDAVTLLTLSNSEWLKRLGRKMACRKVHLARRVARKANPRIRYDAVVGDVLDEPTARLLADVDFLFLASDTIQSRRVFNAIVHQYLIPGIQIGAKVPVDKRTRRIEEIFVCTRPVFPSAGHGCLLCHELVPPARLNDESLTEAERRAQRYVDDPEVSEPSVITLNVLSAGQAVNDLMMMFTGLYADSVEIGHQLSFVRERMLNFVEPLVDEQCLDCASHATSRRAMGDRVRLPCRMPER
jgi:molybdopterin/thiamine biosynthesis adenylyltransferase